MAKYEAEATYKVSSDVKGEWNDSLLGRVEFHFTAGTVTPKSEQEEAALRSLVNAGLAEATETPKRKG